MPNDDAPPLSSPIPDEANDLAWVEEVALFFESAGLPRIAGRILGWLLICEPPHRSSQELHEDLGVSKGSVSAMTRLLMDAALIERVPIPGGRATWFRVRNDGFVTRFETVIDTLCGFAPLANKGVALLSDAPPERSARLREFAALHAFLETEMRGVLDRWSAHRAELVRSGELPE